MDDRRRTLFFGALVLTGVAALRLGAQAPAPAPAAAQTGSIDATVRPFLQKNCVKCHGAQRLEGSTNLEALLASRQPFTAQQETWEAIAYVLQMGQMPPDDEPRLAAAEVSPVVAVLTRELATVGAAPKAPDRPATHEWLTFGYDAERSGFARAETTLSKANLGRIGLLWKVQLDSNPTFINTTNLTLTDPLVAENVSTRQGPKTLVFVASAENSVFAIDKDAGTVVWQRAFPNTAKAPQAASANCPNNLNATPVIDRAASIIYVLASDGKLRGLNLADGEMKFPATTLVPAFSRNYSLNLIDGFVYASTTRGCGGAISEVAALNLSVPEHPLLHFYLSSGKGSGPWGKGGIVKSPTGILVQTADGPYDPASGRFGESLLSLTKDLRLVDSYTPANEAYLNSKDFDLGSGTPLVFPFENRNLVATAAKEGVVYLLDSKNLGGDDHRTPLYTSARYGNDAALFGFNGVWNAMATYADAQGRRWLYVPMYGPTAKETVATFKVQHGPVVNGSLMAFTVQMKDGKPTLVPEWNSADLDLPGTPVIANGVIYILASGDRGATTAARGGGARAGGAAGTGAGAGPAGGGAAAGRGAAGGGRALPLIEVNPDTPGFERDAAWRAAQSRAPDEGGQANGRRYTGGRDTTHAVLYALDPATGEELFSTRDTMDSWNHYGGFALSRGRIYVSTYDARVFAFGLKEQ